VRQTDWGRLAATTSKGADEQSSRRAPGSLVDPGVCIFIDRRLTAPSVQRDQGRNKPHPRSPVQPPPSAAPYLVVGAAAAIAMWAVQQNWVQDSEPKISPPQETGASHSARGDVRAIFSGDDYPSEAQMNGEEGSVQARLSIDPQGVVAKCVIVRTSGHRSLDEATCRIIQKRARFTPARDDRGKAVSDTVVTPPITWRLEG
jgi:protein TonB